MQSKIKKIIKLKSVLAMLAMLSHSFIVNAEGVDHWDDNSTTPHDNEVDITKQLSTVISMTNGTYNNGVDALISGEGHYIDATVTNSVFLSEGGIPLKIDAEDGTASLSVSDSTFETGSESLSDDIEVMGGQGSSLVINKGSVLNEGASAWAGNGSALIQVSDSLIGGNISPGYADNYVLTAQISHSADNNAGTAEVDISNSTLEGNIAVQAQNEGNSVLNLSNKSVVTGYIYAIGQNMQINVDNSEINGNIYTGAYRETEVSETNSTISFDQTTYRHDIISEDDSNSIDNELTVNIYSGAIIGGETLDDPMQIIGYSNVNFNINYLSPSLIDTGKVSYFYVNNGENILVNSSVANGVLTPIRSGSYIYDDVKYQSTDDSQQATNSDGGKTYEVIFYTDDDTPPSDAATDIQATQAGLMASDELIHYISEGINKELDSGPVKDGRNLWLHGIYAGNNRKASQTEYSNEIGGFQIGADASYELRNQDIVSAGLAYARIHDNLDLTNANGGNDINGDYYSAYFRWKQSSKFKNSSRLFSDAIITYGALKYSSNGNDDGIISGGDYCGHSFLLQSRFGDDISLSHNVWLTTYLDLGYDNVHTDGYYDGYSDIGEGQLYTGFYGTGMKISQEFDLENNYIVTPYLDMSYNGDIANSTHLSTEDYTFNGQNLNGAKIGAGVVLESGKKWNTMLSVNSYFGHDVNSDLSTLLSIRYMY